MLWVICLNLEGGILFLALMTSLTGCPWNEGDASKVGDNDVLLMGNRPNGGLIPTAYQAEIASVVIPPGVNAACSDGAAVVTWAQTVPDPSKPAGLGTLRHWAARTDLKCVHDASKGTRLATSCVAQPAGFWGMFPLTAGSSAELPSDAPWVDKIWVAKTEKTVPVGYLDRCDVMAPNLELDESRVDRIPQYATEASADVQMAVLPGGVLVQAGLGERRRSRLYPDPKVDGGVDNGPPYYLENTCRKPLFRNNAVLVRRSDDCGKTWHLVSILDVSEEVSWGPYGYPLALDRIEMEYDDVNNRLVLSGMAQEQWGGKSPISFPLWVSTDQGSSWDKKGDLADPPGEPERWIPGNPVVHSGSKAGRMYFFSCARNGPVLMWSDDALATPPRRWTVDVQGGYPACDFLGQANPHGGTDQEVHRNTVLGSFHQVLPTPSIAVSKMAGSSDGADYVWVAYPSAEELETADPATGDVFLDDRQVAHVLRIRVERSEDGSGTIGGITSRSTVRVTNMFTIAPRDEIESIVFPTLLAPSSIGGVSANDPARGTVVLSWLETSPGPLFHQKARAFSESEWGDLVELSTSGGAAQPWSPTGLSCWPATYKDDDGVEHHWIGRDGHVKQDCGYGDYQYGAFVDKLPDGKLRFLRVWGETDPTIPHNNLEAHGNFLEVQGVWN